MLCYMLGCGYMHIAESILYPDTALHTAKYCLLIASADYEGEGPGKGRGGGG
jgi:hypothetical protein